MIPDWVDDALCREIGSEPFYAEGKGASYMAARAICAACPVTSECLAWALAAETTTWGRYGMFGGLAPKERSALVRRQAGAA